MTSNIRVLDGSQNLGLGLGRRLWKGLGVRIVLEKLAESIKFILPRIKRTKLFDYFIFESIYFLKLSPLFVSSFQSFGKLPI